VTCLNAVNCEGEAGERSLVLVLEQRVQVDLLNAVDVARKQRRDLLAGAVSSLRATLYTTIVNNKQQR